MIGKKLPENPDKALPVLNYGISKKKLFEPHFGLSIDDRTFRKSLRGKTKNRQVNYARMFK